MLEGSFRRAPGAPAVTWAITATLLGCVFLGALCAPRLLARVDPEKRVSKVVCRAVAGGALVFAWVAGFNAEATTWQWILVLLFVPWLFAAVAIPLFVYGAATLLRRLAGSEVCWATNESACPGRRESLTGAGGFAAGQDPTQPHILAPTMGLPPPGDGDLGDVVDRGQVPGVLRLVTFIDVDTDQIDPRRMSITTDCQALLNTGIYVPLIGNRGWCQVGPPTLWAESSIEQIAATARAVVGPLTPLNGHSNQVAEYEHWTHLSTVLREHGVTITPQDLPRLPHHVVLSDRLQARFTPTPGVAPHTNQGCHAPRQPQNPSTRDTTTEHDPIFRRISDDREAEA